jgi:replicative DNA helicase
MAGLPTNVDAERFVLGSILLQDTAYTQAETLDVEDFSLDKHKRIFRRIKELHERDETIDRVTVVNELSRYGDLDACGGVQYIVSLDDGLPQIPTIDAYVRIVKDKAILRRIVYAGQHMMNQAMVGEDEPIEILSGARQTLVMLSERAANSTLLNGTEIYESAGGVNAYLDREHIPQGVSSGFVRFDALTGGFRKGCFYVLGARPRMGKTAFVMNVAENISVKREETTAIFSLEMGKEELLDRLLCSRARVNTKRFQMGCLNSEERKRISRVAGDEGILHRVLIDDKAVTTMGEIHSKIRRLQAVKPIGLVVIDNLQLLLGGEVRYRVGEASRISRDMKLTAKDCQVPILTVSHLNRQCDERSDHRPLLSDLRETGAIEQDADVISFLYRAEVYDDSREDLRGIAELIVAKQRSGPEGVVNLIWQKEIVKFENFAEDIREEGE